MPDAPHTTPIYPARSGLWHVLQARWRHFWSAGSAHAIQSPFVYRLYTEVLRPKADHPLWSANGQFSGYQTGLRALEDLRQALLADETVLSVIDYGAGGQLLATGERQRISRTVQTIAASAAKQPEWAALLMRLVYDRVTGSTMGDFNVLELGTSLGLSTAYLNWGASLAKMDRADKPALHFLTIEGDEAISQQARHNLERIEALARNLKTTEPALQGFDWRMPTMGTGNLDLVLAQQVADWLGDRRLDFVFLDANHTYEATLHYYKVLKPYCHNGTLLVFDDIHWSEGMEAAWRTIIADPDLHVTIDLYQVGLAFFRQEQVKEHFVLK